MDRSDGSDELAFAWRGTRVLVVDAAGAGLAGRREDILPAAATPVGTGAPDVRYRVEPRPPAWNGPVAGYRVVRDGAVRYLGPSLDGLRCWLRADVAATLAGRGGGPLAVRADAVLWRGRAILITGRAGSGTSRLAAALVELGATRGADASVIIGADGRFRPHEGAPPLDVALIVSTSFHPGVGWQPRRLHGARALLPLIDGALPTGVVPGDLLRLVARAGSGLVALQGPRPEAAGAAPHILAALDDLLDHGPPARRRPPAALVRAQRALARHPPATAAAPHT
jgi:hypothetical protein